MMHLNYPILIQPVVFIPSKLLPNHAIIISNKSTDIVIQLVCRDEPFDKVGDGGEIGIGEVKVYMEVSVSRFLTYFSKYTEMDTVSTALCNVLKNSMVGVVLSPRAEASELFGDYFKAFYMKYDEHFNVLREYLEENKHLIFTEEQPTVN